MKRTVIFILALVGVFLSACYTSKKTSRPVTVSVNDDFQVVIDKDPKGHFLDYYTTEQYKENYLN